MARLGPDSLSDVELLALIMRSGRRGASATDVAATLLHRFGSLSGLAGCDLVDLASTEGVGTAKAASIVAALRLASRMKAEQRPTTIQDARDIAKIASQEIAHLRRERVIVLICDATNRLRHLKTLSDGALDHTLLPVRETLHAVLHHDGRAFAVAHNHPSGDPTPSRDDIATTRRLADAASVVGIRFLDHVIVAGDRWCRVE